DDAPRPRTTRAVLDRRARRVSFCRGPATRVRRGSGPSIMMSTRRSSQRRIRNMSFMLSPKWFDLDSRRSSRRLGAKDRRRYRLALLVTPLEERQLLATATLISVSASAANLVFGQSEVLTATVVSNPPSVNVPTGGTVTFNNGGAVLGTAPLTNGTASLT